jgi:predicted alpha/beta superfamily hydrolase
MSASRRGFLGLATALGFGSRSSFGATSTGGAAAAPTPWSLYRSESFILNWRDRAFRIGIARPFDVDPDLPLMLRGYKPVPIYVTDGDENFPIVASIARQMQWGGEVPPCLVVGIDYLDGDRAYKEDWRVRELTPTKAPRAFAPSAQAEAGGAAEFRRFLRETLRPRIESRFDVDRARSLLAGHSLGGMFTLDTLVDEPEAFGNYLSMSPSLWWDDNLVLRSFKQKLESGTVYKSRVAVFAGEQEERISTPETHMTSNTLEFGRLVAGHRSAFPNGALVSVLPGTTHHTIVGTAVTRGLRYLIAPDDRRAETF